MPRVALLDANILLRITERGLASPGARVERAVAELINDGCELRCLAAQVREAYAVLTRAEPDGGGQAPDEAISVLRDVLSLVPVLEDDPAWLEVWMTLVVAHSVTKVRSHDAYLAAAAIATGSLLLTSDEGFRRFGGLNLRLLPKA